MMVAGSTKTKRAAVYVRVSTEEQGLNYSIASQLDLTREHSVKNGYDVIAEYKDIGFTGTNITRPSLTQLLQDVKAGQVDVVIAKAVDRLARGVRPLSAIMDVLDQAHCELEFVEDSYDGTPISRTLLEIRASIGRMERDLFAQRSHAGRVRKAKEGKLNPPPIPLYGYRYDKQTQCFAIDEAQASVVRRMFEEYAGGASPQRIAYSLNLEGVPTNGRSQYGWSGARISGMLKRTEYYGEGYANRYRGGSTAKSNQRPREEWIPFPYPAIITRELYDKAIERRHSNKRWSSQQRAKPEYLLVGLLHCSECGMKFLVDTEYRQTTKRLKSGEVKRYESGPKRMYHCGGTTRYPHLYDCRRPRWLRAKPLEDLVWGQVFDALKRPEVILEGLRARQEKLEGELTDISEQLARMEQRIKGSALEEQRVITLFRKGHITEEQLGIQLKAVREEAAYWTEEHERLQSLASQGAQAEHVRQTVEAISRRLESVETWSFELKREIMRALVARVWVDREGKVTIELHLPQIELGSTDSTPYSSCSGTVRAGALAPAAPSPASAGPPHPRRTLSACAARARPSTAGDPARVPPG